MLIFNNNILLFYNYYIIIMKQILIHLLLIILIKFSSSQCSLACSSCLTSITDCATTCPSFFNYSATLSPSCFINTNRYNFSSIVSYTNLLYFISNTNQMTCSPFTQQLFGPYSQSTLITMLNASNTLPLHTLIRVRTSIVWIDNWIGSSLFTIFIDNSKISSIYYNNVNVVSLSGTNCNTTSYGVSYVILDTNQISHTNSSVNVSFNMGSCNCTVNNSVAGCPNYVNPACWICQTCSWAIADIFILFVDCAIGCATCYGSYYWQCYTCKNVTFGATTTLYYLSGTYCQTNCSTGYYIPSVNPTPNVCNMCDTSCIRCTLNSTNCGSAANCNTGYSYYNKICVNQCPDGKYNNNGTCVNCEASCYTCNDGSSSNCTACSNSTYLYLNTCVGSCPNNWIADPTLLICQDCTNNGCLELTMSIYTNNMTSPLYILMNFTGNIDFENFSMNTFQTIQFADKVYNINMFTIEFINITSNSYIISLIPISPIILVNQTVIVTTMQQPTTPINGSNGIKMLYTAFNVSMSNNWTYFYNPNTIEQQILMQALSEMSSGLNTLTTLTGYQQIKKFGFILLILNSLQITSCILLLNIYLPKNLYQFIRFFASLIFFDVPPYQQPLTSNKYIINLPTANYINTPLNQTNFQRTGFTSIFLFDSYSQIFFIIGLYILLLVFKYYNKKNKKSLQKYIPYVEWVLFNFHEIAIMYFTLTILFEFTYFTSTSSIIRYTSIILCVLINFYMLFYYVCRYYDLMNYPYLNISDPQYDEFANKYGSLLRNIRFQEYKQEQKCWQLRNLLRPYNYHFVSYIKKIAMMLSIPLFYQYPIIQILSLLIIQCGQIIRFVVTWPFAQRWRNLLKLLLEIILFCLFLTLLLMQLTVDNLRSNGPQILTLVLLYKIQGWIGISCVFLFNMGYLLIGLIDIYIGCYYSPKELMNQQRKKYYFEILDNYEQSHYHVPVKLMNEWVRKGNLNNRKIDSLPKIFYKIETYHIKRKKEVFELYLKLVSQLFMENQFNYKKQNNVKPGKKIEFKTIINQQDGIYNLINQIYQTYSNFQTNRIVVYTFLEVEQSKFQPGQFISLDRKKMHQEIIIESENGQSNQLKIEILEGFPLTEIVFSEVYQQNLI